ncbi:DUF1223 domain-containing protein [Burkholderia alba]|uniref:DUF1223 domain-containing protein n=1 Tax=Burkholderia alba TaxID=2683677 RepID=UPI002B05F6D3|nr:DUF1223 domain-containing protein [Burkholderia alba]
MSLFNLIRFGMGAAALAAACVAQAGAACSAASPAYRQALVELYTSEGCSSCRPADDWLARLGASPAALRIVPLALHVDDWDGLGWRDRFAQSRFTARQNALAARSGGGFIYTPEVAVAGRELRNWRDPDAFERRLREIGGQPPTVDLALTVAQQGGRLAVRLAVTPRAGAPRRLGTYLALYENGVVSDVRAGENRGATLRHERVVRQWLGPVDAPPSGAGTFEIRREWPLEHVTGGRYGVAAFVEDGAGDVLQAVDLPLCG